MITRRVFLGQSAACGAALLSPARAWEWPETAATELLSAPLLNPAPDEILITILHTNDTHSQIEPLPKNDRSYPDKGGVARRASLVQRLRKQNPHTLLIDAGDAFQGSPYFNYYKGEVEYRTMSAIGYNVGTLGNHEFDNGVGALAEALKFANFPIVSTNYDVRKTALENLVKPYVLRGVGGVRIGLFGLGISPEGLITPDNFKGITYHEPVQVSRNVVKILRETERCDLVVCLSHLGYYPKPKEKEIGDTQVAAQVDGIDFIASGHTHTFMERPVTVKQPSGKETVIFQVGKSGIYVGRVDFTLRAGKVTAWAGRLLDLRDV